MNALCFPSLCLAFAALAWLGGCAALSGLVNPTARLLEQAREAVEEKDPDTAWARLVGLRERHPDSTRRSRPELARWAIRVEDDDGIVETVAAQGPR